MSIKPVDMQVLLPRSQEIQKGEMVKDSKTNTNNQFILVNNNKEAQKNLTKVLETNQSAFENIKLKDEGKQQQGKKQGFSGDKQDKKADIEAKNAIEPENLGKHIDIKI